MTQSRELANYCQHSVRPSNASLINKMLKNTNNDLVLDLLVKSFIKNQFDLSSMRIKTILDEETLSMENLPPYLKVIDIIEHIL